MIRLALRPSLFGLVPHTGCWSDLPALDLWRGKAVQCEPLVGDFMLVEGVGGLLTGRLALLAPLAIGLAWRPTTTAGPYGFYRLEISSSPAVGAWVDPRRASRHRWPRHCTGAATNQAAGGLTPNRMGAYAVRRSEHS